MKSRSISVSATGEASIAPDLAVVSFAVTGSGKELSPTRNDVNSRSSRVLATLRELGVAEADIKAPDVSIHPEYDHRRGQQLVGYRVVRQMTSRVRDLERLGEVLDGIIGAGANEVHGTEMTASDPSAAEHAALAAAVSSARAKADVLAAAAGVPLGVVARIEEETDHGGPSPQFRMLAATAESADISTEVAPGELTVVRRVRVWFLIG